MPPCSHPPRPGAARCGSKYNLSCAQLLLNSDTSLSDPDTVSQLCETTNELLRTGTVPVLNDNDALNAGPPCLDAETQEARPPPPPPSARANSRPRAHAPSLPSPSSRPLPRPRQVLWDNDVLDVLAARVAAEMHADLLVLLSDMDGLFTDGGDGARTRLSHFAPSAPLAHATVLATDDSTEDEIGLGRAGGRTRLSAPAFGALVLAARTAVAGGVRAAAIATGHHPLSLTRLVRGEAGVGTLFTGDAQLAPSRL